MTPDDIATLFGRPSGGYGFARWGRPIVPVVFGVATPALDVIKGAIEAVVALAGHQMAETDPELGANLMVFFFRDWAELLDVPNLDRLIDGLDPLVARLETENANRYRIYRFDAAGAIRACFSFVRMDDDLAETPAEVLALSLAGQMILAWSDRAFSDRAGSGRAMLARAEGAIILHPEIGDVIRAAYDRTMPEAASDPSHALRLAARVAVLTQPEGEC